jgi:hypothetical protein
MIKNSTICAGLVVSAISLGNLSAQADTFAIQFTASDFVNLSDNGVAAPTDPLTGVITYEATGINNPILAFDSINLTIDGHSYAPTDLGFFEDGVSPIDQIGAVSGGVTAIYSRTDDFTFLWNRNTLAPFQILYSSSQRDGIFLSTTFTSSTVVTAVPEPSVTALCFLAGGALLPMVRRQSQKRRLSSPVA